MISAKRSLVMITAFILGLALAVGTPAGEEITNQATAKYTDSAGAPQTTNSNQVITVVKQVYGVSLVTDGTVAAPGQSQNATPGSTVYYPYTLTNTGNGSDSFTLTSFTKTDDTSGITAPVFYIDSNGDGVFQTGEPQVTSVADLPATDGANTVKLIMAYQIPTDATAASAGPPVVAADTIIAMPIATSDGDATKFDGDPAVASDGLATNNYHQTTVVQDAVLNVTKAVSVSEALPGATLTYTISATNTGSLNATAVNLTDAAPTGTTIVAASVATVPAGNAADTSVPVAIFATVVPGQKVTMSFQVTVDASTVPGSLDNTAAFSYTGSTTPTPPATTGTTNTATTTILATYGTVLGPKDDPTNLTAVSYTSAEGYTVTSAITTDVQVVASANAGTPVSFINSVQNTGTGTDVFDITIDSTALALPSGASVLLTRLDGTPLSDTDGDGIPDSGPLAPGAEFDFVVKILLPQGYNDQDGTTTVHSVAVTATSSQDATKTDSTTNTINDVVGPGVAFGNNTGTIDNNGAVDSTVKVTETENPGDSAVFPMDVVNTGSSTDSYDLTGTADFTDTSGGTITVPVVYYPASADTSGDGTLSPAEIAAATPITNTGSLSPVVITPATPGQEVTVFAVVDVPATATPQTVAVTQSATSPLSGATAPFNIDEVTVNPIKSFTFNPDRNGTAPSPGTVIYQHSITNNGNLAITDVDFTEAASGNVTGWTYLYSYDGATYYPAASVPTIASLAPGASQNVFVRVNVPAGVPKNAANILTVTAAPTFGSDAASTGSDSVVDTTIVISGELTVLKEWSLTGTVAGPWFKGDGTDTGTVPEVAPGENIYYRMTVTNIGTGNVTATEILDSVPTFTDFVIASQSGGTVTCSSDGGVSYAACPTTVAGAVDTSITGLTFTLPTLAPGAVQVVNFAVQVQ